MKRLAIVLAAVPAAVVLLAPAAAAQPTCPPGWRGIYVGTRLVACLPPS